MPHCEHGARYDEGCDRCDQHLREENRAMSALIEEIEQHANRHQFVDASGSGESSDLDLIRAAIAKWREAK